MMSMTAEQMEERLDEIKRERLLSAPMFKQEILREIAPTYARVTDPMVRAALVKDTADDLELTEDVVLNCLERYGKGGGNPSAGSASSPQASSGPAVPRETLEPREAAQQNLLARVMAMPGEVKDAVACGVTAGDFVEPYKTIWEIIARGHRLGDPRIPEKYTKLAAALQAEPPVGALYPAPELARKLKALNAQAARKAAITTAIRQG